MIIINREMKHINLFFILIPLSLSQETTSSTPSSTPPSSSSPSSSTIDSPRIGIDFIGPLWLPRSFKITCCRGGTPIPENDLLIRNWTQSVSDYAVDEDSDEGCRIYEGNFLLAATALFKLRTFTGYGVQCKCPGDTTNGLDKHCRKLPPCHNNGYRSFSLNMRCACPEPFFGDFCEKYCDQGQKLKGVDGRDYCSCVPFYQGEECRDMVCLNGGVESGRRCACPPNFLGYHCEIDANRTTVLGGSRFQKYQEAPNDFFTRDISGTIFSLIMIIVLVVSMYLLMKHRMHGGSGNGSHRREEQIRSIYGLPRRGDTVRPSVPTTLPFSALGIDGPPPYAPVQSRSGGQPEILPPLPSYDDATKIPAMRPPIVRSTIQSIEEVPSTSTTSPPLESIPSIHSSIPPISFNRIIPSRRSV